MVVVANVVLGWPCAMRFSLESLEWVAERKQCSGRPAVPSLPAFFHDEFQRLFRFHA
jgi:hypothetical protein